MVDEQMVEQHKQRLIMELSKLSGDIQTDKNREFLQIDFIQRFGTKEEKEDLKTYNLAPAWARDAVIEALRLADAAQTSEAYAGEPEGLTGPAIPPEEPEEVRRDEAERLAFEIERYEFREEVERMSDDELISVLKEEYGKPFELLPEMTFEQRKAAFSQAAKTPMQEKIQAAGSQIMSRPMRQRVKEYIEIGDPSVPTPLAGTPEHDEFFDELRRQIAELAMRIETGDFEPDEPPEDSTKIIISTDWIPETLLKVVKHAFNFELPVFDKEGFPIFDPFGDMDINRRNLEKHGVTLVVEDGLWVPKLVGQETWRKLGVINTSPRIGTKTIHLEFDTETNAEEFMKWLNEVK